MFDFNELTYKRVNKEMFIRIRKIIAIKPLLSIDSGKTLINEIPTMHIAIRKKDMITIAFENLMLNNLTILFYA